jgi:hypothetical protein
MITKKSLTAILFSAALSPAGQAFAGEPLVLLTDQTQLLAVPRTPGTVVVGNPSIADVTIQGQQVFLHGRAFGTTNIMILDETGAEIADFEVTVQLGGSNNVALYKAGARYSYVCAPDCEATFQVGDAAALFNQVTDQAKQKTNLATGKTSKEASDAPKEQ